MSTIIDIKKEIVKFLKENINCDDVTVIKIQKVKGIWNTLAEVYENDSFLKSMNLPPKQVRLFYSVKIDDNHKITAFERLSSYAVMDSVED